MKLWWCHSSTWRSTSFLREARSRLVHLSIVVRSDSNKLCLMKDNSAHVVPGHAACVWSLVHVQPRNVEVLGLERNFLEIYEGFIASDLWVSVDYERPHRTKLRVYLPVASCSSRLSVWVCGTKPPCSWARSLWRAGARTNLRLARNRQARLSSSGRFLGRTCTLSLARQQSPAPISSDGSVPGHW